MKRSQHSPFVDEQLSDLVKQVQRNCDIADAKYGGNDSLCIYLLKMRDQYIWKNSIELGAEVDRKALGKWINQTEDYWDQIEEMDLQPLDVSGDELDCFDSQGVNERINPHGWVYSAGLGQRI